MDIRAIFSVICRVRIAHLETVPDATIVLLYLIELLLALDLHFVSSSHEDVAIASFVIMVRVEDLLADLGHLAKET